MIPKKDMKPGFYYKGTCRGTYVATWSESEDCFLHVDWNFGVPYVERIKHFEDVKHTNTDGFIPVEVIEKLDINVYIEVRREVGY